MRLTSAVLVVVLVTSAGWAKDFVSPDQIVYDMVPGFGPQGGTEILEWERKSASGSGEPAVPATINAPSGLRLRWLGAAGFAATRDRHAISMRPFMLRAS